MQGTKQTRLTTATPVIMFVDADADISKVTIPDDSLLVGFDARPAQRTPEWVLGPEGNHLYSVWHADDLVGLTCPVCDDTKEKHGYLFHHNDEGMIGVFQCSNCGTITFPEWRVNPPANKLYALPVHEEDESQFKNYIEQGGGDLV